MRLRALLACAVLLTFVAVSASALPVLSLSTSSIAVAPGTTDITFSVDPNGTPLAAFVMNFSVNTGEIQLVNAGCWVSVSFGPSCDVPGGLFGAAGTFFVNQTAPFTVGTVRVRGLVPGALLAVSGNWTDGNFTDIPFSDTALATVVPEPGTLALLALGLVGVPLARIRRRRNG